MGASEKEWVNPNGCYDEGCTLCNHSIAFSELTHSSSEASICNYGSMYIIHVNKIVIMFLDNNDYETWVEPWVKTLRINALQNDASETSCYDLGMY